MPGDPNRPTGGKRAKTTLQPLRRTYLPKPTSDEAKEAEDVHVLSSSLVLCLVTGCVLGNRS